MKNKHPQLTADRLREVLSYDPETGDFFWRSQAGRIPAGTKAGTIDSDGYVQICIDLRLYRGHRLAWLYTTGQWPAVQIDHRNGIRSENWINNLREATNAQNGQNINIRRNNTSGHPGVSWCKKLKKWQARIRAQGRRVYIGSFSDIADAIEARAQAKAKLHTFQPQDRWASKTAGDKT